MLRLLFSFIHTISPQVWWQFAIRCVINGIKERNNRLSVNFIVTRARQCVSYVSAYTVHLTSATPSEEVMETLSDVEEHMNYEEIVILRRLAMQRVEKERALAEVSERKTLYMYCSSVHVL